MSQKYSVRIRTSFDDAEVIIPTSYGYFSTAAYEVAIMHLPGGFDEWKVAKDGDAPATVRYMSKDGKKAIARLYKGDAPAADFDEEDKPQNTAPFTVFGGGETVPCADVKHLGSVIAQMIISHNRRPKKIVRTA